MTQYIVTQVEELVGYNLNNKEIDAVSEMFKLGCTTRQMACKVNQLAAIDFANQRRELHLKKLKQLGTTLNGAEMTKFKMQVDKQDGVVPDWEKQGYPAAYKTIEIDKGTKKKPSKRVKKLIKRVKKIKTKKDEPKKKPVKTCLDILNCMEVVD